MRWQRTALAGLVIVAVGATALQSTPADAVSGQPTTPIVVTEQSQHEIVVLDPTMDWNSPSARLWSWKPGPESDINAPASAWLHPDDARLRTDQRTGKQYVMVSDSYGLVAQVPYPDAGKVAWSVKESNPHGVELLPDGNVAVAVSTGGWVRVYTASQGRTSEVYAEASLSSAHQVYWDAKLEVLWALGDTELVKFAIGGTPAKPTIKRVETYELPTRGGHDLQPVSGDDDHLWLTTVYGVFQFSKTTEKIRARYPRFRELYSPNVKSVATDLESGTVLESVVQPGNPCGHCTDTVELYIGADEVVYKTVPGWQVYRARWFDEQSN